MDRYLSVGPGAWDAECSNLSVQIVQNGRAARAQAFEFCLDNLWGSSSGILEHLGVSCGKHGVSYGFPVDLSMVFLMVSGTRRFSQHWNAQVDVLHPAAWDELWPRL